jgi:CubicO group peptidase (beta-lactamase class C family)
MSHFRAFLFLTVFLAAAPAFAQRADPALRAHVEALVAALSSGSPAAFEAMAQEHFAPELLARRSADDRKALVEKVHGDFGALEIERAMGRDDTLEVRVRGERGATARLELSFEPAPPRRITRIAIEAGDARDEEASPLPPPPVKGTMAPDELSRALDAYLGRLADSDGFAGVVLVAREGTALYERAYGLANRESKTAITPATRFNLASIGKAFTKAAIAQLIAQGKLALSDTIGSLLPEYPNAEAKGATVAQLLEHQAGIADFFGPAFAQAPKERFSSNADYYRFVASQPLLFAPGSRREYCNGCYVVLGAIIERLGGVPYEEYVAKSVFARAGMKGASFLAMNDLPADAAIGYARPRPSGTAPLEANQALHGRRGSAAGGSYARAEDLLAFDNALRENRLFDAKTTAWFLGTQTTEGRARGPLGIAGGAPGVNAILESDGVWTVVVVGNLDPPNAGRIGKALLRQLAG